MVLKSIEPKNLGGMDYSIYKFILEPFYKRNKATEYRINIYQNVFDENMIIFDIAYEHYIIKIVSTSDYLELNIADIVNNKTYNKITLSYREDFCFTTMKKLIDLEIQTIL